MAIFDRLKNTVASIRGAGGSDLEYEDFVWGDFEESSAGRSKEESPQNEERPRIYVMHYKEEECQQRILKLAKLNNQLKDEAKVLEQRSEYAEILKRVNEKIPEVREEIKKLSLEKRQIILERLLLDNDSERNKKELAQRCKELAGRSGYEEIVARADAKLVAAEKAKAESLLGEANNFLSK